MRPGEVRVLTSPEGAKFEVFYGIAKGKRIYAVWGFESLNDFGRFSSYALVVQFVKGFKVAK